MLKKLVIWTLLLAAVVAATLHHLGAFETIFVVERPVGPLRFVYRTLPGANFYRVGRLTKEVSHALNVAGATRIDALGLYYPAGSAKPNEIGCVVDDVEIPALANLDPQYSQRDIPREMAVTVRFPYENPLSYVMGFYRVMPLLRAHRAKHHYRDGLAYTLFAGDMILYVQPIVTENGEPAPISDDLHVDYD